MPITDVHGLMGPDEEREKLRPILIERIPAVKELGISPEFVQPRILKTEVIEVKHPDLGKFVTISVPELFTVGCNKVPRTPENLKLLRMAIKNGFNYFLTIAKLDVRPENVAIIFNMINKDQEYYTWNIPEVRNECTMHGSIEHMQSIDGKCPECKNH